MALFLPRRWMRQPQYPVAVDYANPLCANIAFVVNTKTHNHEANAGVVLSNASTARWNHEGFLSDGLTAGTYTQVSPAAILGGLTESSVFALTRTTAAIDTAYPGPAGNISGGGNAIYCERGSSGNDIYKLCWTDPADGSYSGTLDVEFTYRNDSGALLQQRQIISGKNDGRLTSSGLSKNGTAHTVYTDGIGESGTFGSSSTAFTDASVESWIGDDKGDPASVWNGSILLVVGWRRALSAAEHLELSINPWQIFRPQSARIYSFSTGAAPSSTVPPLYHQRQQQGMAS